MTHRPEYLHTTGPWTLDVTLLCEHFVGWAENRCLKLEVVFYRNLRLLVEAGAKYEMKAEGDRRILVIHKANYKDEAEFTCSAGDCETTAKLTVQGYFCECLLESTTPFFIYVCL